MIEKEVRLDRETCPGVDALTAFNDGRLAEAQMEVVADHLSSCAVCLQYLSELHQQAHINGWQANLRRLVVAPALVDSQATLTNQSLTASLNERTRSIPANWIGKKIGGYVLQKELGAGGMGMVFLAEQEEIKQQVALKLIACSLPLHEEYFQRFQTECQAINRLRHPNIIQFLHYGEYNDTPYYTMEYHPKGSLSERLKKVRLTQREAVKLVRTIALTMAFAHEHNVIHRDLKPANILLKPDGEPVIMDFGLAKLLDSADGRTITNAIMGSPSYMAPEQADGNSAKANALTDVYALGAILYDCLTGKAPFRGKDKLEIMLKVRTERVKPPSAWDDSIPLALESICLKCLEKEPAKRYPSANALVADLDQWLNEGKSLATPSCVVRTLRGARQWSIPAAIVLGAILLSGGLYWSDPERPVQNIKRQLERGQSVSFLNNEQTTPYRIRHGADDAKVTFNPDGSMTVSAWKKVCLVEFIPSVPTDHYTIEALVQHEQGEPVSYIGVYAAHQRAPGITAEGINTFVGMAYNDIWDAKSEATAKGMPADLLAQMNLPTENNVRLGFAGCGIRSDSIEFQAIPPTGVQGATFKPRGQAGGAWRTLQLEITNDEMIGHCNKDMVGRFSAVMFRLEMKRQLDQQIQFLPNDPYFPAIVPKYLPRGGLGVFVFKAAATFKNVIVTPQH